MTLVGRALNLGEKMKIYSQVLTFFIKPQIWLFYLDFFADDGKEMDKSEKRTCRPAKLLFLPTKYANV